MSKTVALFVTCLVENMRPKVGFDSIALLEDAGFSVVVPNQQVCCGQPNYNGGDKVNAQNTARFVVDTFLQFDHTIVPSGSCAGMIKHHYPQLFEDNVEYLAKAKKLAERTFELTQFLSQVGYQPRIGAHKQVTYHDGCAGLRELNIYDQPRTLLRAKGTQVTELTESEGCCGFGGNFCVKYPEVSGAMVDKKIADIESTHAATVVMGDLGCLLNIEGRISRLDKRIVAKHVAEELAEELTEEPTEEPTEELAEELSDLTNLNEQGHSATSDSGDLQ